MLEVNDLVRVRFGECESGYKAFNILEQFVVTCLLNYEFKRFSGP